jgi:hypothetical protein
MNRWASTSNQGIVISVSDRLGLEGLRRSAEQRAPAPEIVDGWLADAVQCRYYTCDNLGT